MPLLKDALLILQSLPPTVITSQDSFFFPKAVSNPSDLMRIFAFQPLGLLLEVERMDMSYEATVGLLW